MNNKWCKNEMMMKKKCALHVCCLWAEDIIIKSSRMSKVTGWVKMGDGRLLSSAWLHSLYLQQTQTR